MPVQYGATPLHVAAGCGHTAIVALLLATPGVDPLARDTQVGGSGTLLSVGLTGTFTPLPPL